MMDFAAVTANSEATPGDTLTKVMDVNSFSYTCSEYDDFHIKYPFRTIIGGESASCVSDRSTYIAACQGPGKGENRCSTENCTRNANLIRVFCIENAERMENCP